MGASFTVLNKKKGERKKPESEYQERERPVGIRLIVWGRGEGFLEK
jgi:hypothetical protein